MQSDNPNHSDIDRPTVVEIKNVSMVFNMASEQFNSLKEYAIALARRELMFKEFRALNNISFEVKKGEVFGLMGTNGSGKSTMLKIIAGVLDPTEGTCRVTGTIAPLIELGAGFDMDLTARENIYLNSALLGYSRGFVDKHFDDIVSFAEIEDFLDIPMKNYSSGMVSRIAFSIATVIVPDILVCDEVLSVGDFMFQKKCEDKIRELIDNYGVTVLIVSHSNDQIARLCDRAIWIEKGNTYIIDDAQKVCRIYSNIGGRSGSQEAQERVKRSLGEEPARDISKYITAFPGGTCFESAVNICRHVYRDKPTDTVILLARESHINCLFAGSISGLVGGAETLVVSLEEIPMVVEHYLYQTTPKRIILLCSGASMEAIAQHVTEYPWEPEVIDLGIDERQLDYSATLLKKGASLGQWGSTALFCDYEDLGCDTAATIYAARNKAPVVCKWGKEEGEEISGICSNLKACGIDTVAICGPTAFDKEEELKTQGFQTISLSSSEKEIEASNQVFRHSEIDEGKVDTIAILPAPPSRCTHCYSISNFTNERNIRFVYLDSTSLDSIASLLDDIDEQKVKKIIVLGGDDAFAFAELQLYATEIETQLKGC